MDLIPGLPNEIGLECMIRVPHTHFSSVSSVCRRWNAEIRQPEFRRLRQASGLAQSLVVMVQARVNPSEPRSDTLKRPVNQVFRLAVFEPETGKWSELPPMPGYENGLPMFCRIVGVGLKLVVMGGWDPETWLVSNLVFVFDFLSGTWSCGSEMPGGLRSFFACASDLDQMVYIAGGHDREKNALRSALAYDVAKDEWVQLPDLATERDECKGVFHRGKFHVIGGYTTEMQGQFSTSAEAFDVGSKQWDTVEDEFLDVATCRSTCLDGGDGRMYVCRANDVAVRWDSTWRAVAELPAGMRGSTVFLTAWKGQIMVTGTPGFDGPHRAYVLDLKRYKWTQAEVPEEYSGHVQSGCWVEI